jgi:hypothetical protein
MKGDGQRSLYGDWLWVGGPRGRSFSPSRGKIFILFTPVPLYYRGKSPRYPQDSRLDGPQGPLVADDGLVNPKYVGSLTVHSGNKRDILF